MRINSSEIAFQSAHQRTDVTEERVTLQVWRAPADAPRADTVTLSQRAIQASALPAPDVGGGTVSDDGLSPALSLVKQVLEDLLGVRIEVYQPQSADAAPAEAVPASTPQPAPATAPIARAPTSGAGFELTALRTRTQSEQLSLSAQGVVRTEDGREIRIALSLDLQRSYVESSSLTVRGGSEAPKRKDPLVINLGGQSTQFEADRIEFDLDADGVAEHIPNVTAASGFIALDRNGNGRIDDGAELFGARSGQGFAELAQLDDDHNGWIDQSDAAYSQLQIWRRDAQGQDHSQSLAQAGVGALQAAGGSGRFELRDADNQAQAELRSTGLYLTESGQAGTVQQYDFFV